MGSLGVFKRNLKVETPTFVFFQPRTMTPNTNMILPLRTKASKSSYHLDDEVVVHSLENGTVRVLRQNDNAG